MFFFSFGSVIGQVTLVALSLVAIFILGRAYRSRRTQALQEDFILVLLRSAVNQRSHQEIASTLAENLGEKTSVTFGEHEVHLSHKGMEFSVSATVTPYLPTDLEAEDNPLLSEALASQRSSLVITLWRQATAPVTDTDARTVLVEIAMALDDPAAVALLDANSMTLVPLDVETMLAVSSGRTESIFRNGFKIEVFDDESEVCPLEEAVAEARAQFEKFRTAYRDGIADDNLYLVKATFPSDTYRSENLWVVVRDLGEATIRGQIDNDPISLKHLSYGDEVVISVEDVVDWMYEHRGQVVGGFTQRVFRE